MSVFKHGINQIRFRGIEEAGKHRLGWSGGGGGLRRLAISRKPFML